MNSNLKSHLLSLISVLVLLLMVGGCGDPIRFEEPQPLERKDLKTIPVRLRGKYVSTDSTFLTITNSSIIDWFDVKGWVLKDSMDIEIDSSQIVLQNENYIELVDGKYNLNLLSRDDSVLMSFSFRDTLFSISNKQILRRYKGHYFLNYKISENRWKVKRLTLSKDELSFSAISIPEEISKIQEITEVEVIKSDSGEISGYVLNPSKKELKELMKHSFNETEKYRKL